jgi:hypothetical protein
MSHVLTRRARAVRAYPRTGKAIKSGPKFILCLLADTSRDDARAWPSVGTLAADSGMSERAVQAALRVLESGGLISGERAPGKVTVWTLHLPDLGPAGAGPGVNGHPFTPAESAPQTPDAPPQNPHHPPAESAPPPPQNSTQTPAESAPKPLEPKLEPRRSRFSAREAAAAGAAGAAKKSPPFRLHSYPEGFAADDETRDFLERKRLDEAEATEAFRNHCLGRKVRLADRQAWQARFREYAAGRALLFARPVTEAASGNGWCDLAASLRALGEDADPDAELLLADGSHARH